MNDVQARRAIAAGVAQSNERPKGVLMKNAGGACRCARTPEEELDLFERGFRPYPPPGLLLRHGAANPEPSAGGEAE